MRSNRRNTSDLLFSTVYGNKIQSANLLSNDNVEVCNVGFDTIQDATAIPEKNPIIVYPDTEPDTEPETDLESDAQQINEDSKSDSNMNWYKEKYIDIKNDINECLHYIEKIKEKCKHKKEQVKYLKDIVCKLITNIYDRDEGDNSDISNEYIQQIRCNSREEYEKMKSMRDEEERKKIITSKNVVFRTIQKK